MTRRTYKNSERGQITLDFLFGSIMIIGVSAILGALTFALTLTEVLQYVSFSAGRNYFAGDLDREAQTTAATKKAQFLIAKLPFLAGARNSEWIKIEKGAADNYSDTGNGYETSLNIRNDTSTFRRNQFTGYQITFTLPILNIKIPLLGAVMQPPDGDSFHGTVSSFLMREPSTDECMRYTKAIYDAIKNKGGFTQAPPAGNFIAINDNGC